MAVIQITKIQLRRGRESELDVNSLDTGELGFATDTGRLFVGTDPQQVGFWSSREVLPYDNIEVLTEASVDTFARIFDRLNRMTGPVGTAEGGINRRPFIEAELEANTSEWTSVPIFRLNASGQIEDSLVDDLVLSRTKSLSARIEYFVFDNARVIRSGVMTILHDGDSPLDEAVISDEHVSDFVVSGNGASLLSDTLFDTGLRFRAVRSGTNPNYQFHLQYRNETEQTLRIQMRVIVAAKPQ